jgi:hypothetical protein
MANQNTKVNMKKVWEKYGRGDHITDRELDEAIQQTRQAVQYLEDRGEKWHLAWLPLVNDLSQLERFQRNRDRKKGHESESQA